MIISNNKLSKRFGKIVEKIFFILLEKIILFIIKISNKYSTFSKSRLSFFFCYTYINCKKIETSILFLLRHACHRECYQQEDVILNHSKQGIQFCKKNVKRGTTNIHAGILRYECIKCL